MNKLGIFMNFWEKTWDADHIKYVNKVADIGFDILEFQAQALLDMSKERMCEIRSAAEGRGIDRNTRCQMLENMMVHKLFLNQAKLDSLVVNEDNVEAELQSRISNVLTGLGSEKAVEKQCV